MNEVLDPIFKSGILAEKYDSYNDLWSRNDEYPYFNYFGINFDRQGILSVKLYFHVFHPLKKEEVLMFIPATDDFFKYYHLHDFSKSCTTEHSGCALEVKFKRDSMKPAYGFHFRLRPVKEAYDLIGYPGELPYDALSLNTRPGINYEYGDEEALRKRYYYLDKPEHASYFAKRFGRELIGSAHLIEYSESDIFAKINTWYGRTIEEIPERTSLISNYGNEVINYLLGKYDIMSNAIGFYENRDIVSVYFFGRNSVKPASCGASSSSHYVDTFKILCP